MTAFDTYILDQITSINKEKIEKLSTNKKLCQIIKQLKEKHSKK